MLWKCVVSELCILQLLAATTRVKVEETLKNMELLLSCRVDGATPGESRLGSSGVVGGEAGGGGDIGMISVRCLL